jgi:hypothetical protein
LRDPDINHVYTPSPITELKRGTRIKLHTHKSNTRTMTKRNAIELTAAVFPREAKNDDTTGSHHTSSESSSSGPDETIAVVPAVTIMHNDHDIICSSLLDNVDVLTHITKFIGAGQYRFVAAISRNFRIAYTKSYPEKTTILDASTMEHTKICWSESNDHNTTMSHILHLAPYDIMDDENTRTKLRHLALCINAAWHGNNEVLQYLIEDMGCCWDYVIAFEADRYGHFDLVKSLIRSRCHSLDCAFDIEYLYGLQEYRCPWDEYTYPKEATCSRLQVLKWAYKHGCRCVKKDILNMASKDGYDEIIRKCI